MRYEFSWKLDGEAKHFGTSDPAMAEVMMRSQADFPRRTADIQKQFHDLYGAQQGAFAAFLREAAQGPGGEILSPLTGFSIHMKREEGAELC